MVGTLRFYKNIAPTEVGPERSKMLLPDDERLPRRPGDHTGEHEEGFRRVTCMKQMEVDVS
jgi:hypothetical protein